MMKLPPGEVPISPSATLDDLPAGLSVTVEGFSRMVGVSVSTIRTHLRTGLLRLSGRNRLPVAKSIRLYCEHLGQSSAKRAKSERERLLGLQSDLAALKLAKARGELLEVAAVEREWQSILRGVRSELLALPTRFAARVALSPADLAALEVEIGDALEALADDPSRTVEPDDEMTDAEFTRLAESMI